MIYHIRLWLTRRQTREKMFFLPRRKPWPSDARLIGVYESIQEWVGVELSGVFFQAGLEFTMLPRLASDSHSNPPASVCYVWGFQVWDSTPTWFFFFFLVIESDYLVLPGLQCWVWDRTWPPTSDRIIGVSHYGQLKWRVILSVAGTQDRTQEVLKSWG